MPGKRVLDTNIIIGLANGVEAATRLIDERGDNELCTSVMSRVELLSLNSLPLDEERRIIIPKICDRDGIQRTN